MVQIFAIAVLLFWIISRIRKNSKLFITMMTLFAVAIIVGAGVKEIVNSDSKESTTTSTVITTDSSNELPIQGIFGDLYDPQIFAFGGQETHKQSNYVEIRPYSSNEEHTQTATAERASPIEQDSS